MSAGEPTSAGVAAKPSEPSQEAVLRRLFLTLFLRGRTARGLRKETAPKSIGRKLALTLAFYALFGALALSFVRQPVFTLSIYLHAMTFVFLGMFVTGSAGEVLFSKDEADILLHRPVRPATLLRAKVRVLVEVSLWIAGAFNLVGLGVGWFASDGGWRYPLAHAVSMTLEALFCTGCVVLTYQLCLRWCGRERLEGLVTSAQVIVSITIVLAGQLLPRLMSSVDTANALTLDSWWLGLLPPAWFAGLDDALCGHGTPVSWTLGASAVIGTGVVLVIAFGKLARAYEFGQQALNEAAADRPSARARGRRWRDAIVSAPPLRWWLRDPVARASFLLCTAYLLRDRDVKLRIYPALAPMLVMPFVMLMPSHRSGASGFAQFGIAFAGSFLCILPALALRLLQYSQQWQASDLFRAAPIPGPGQLCHGARCAVVFFLALPLLVIFGLAILFLRGDCGQLLLLLPSVISLPIFALMLTIGGKAVPLSLPSEDAKAAGRGIAMIGMIFVSMTLAALVACSWSTGWFWWLVLVELAIALPLGVALRRSLTSARWLSLE